jgi:predicted nucleic acid-binding protein
MDQGYLLDPNVIIGYLAGKIPDHGMEAISAIIDQASHISVISQIEVLRFNDTAELVTRNIDDFKNVPELELLNPWDVT